jgi:type IV pilus assembly protein PilA
MHLSPRPQGGYTLIEILIALAVVGLLAAIALPSYGNYVRRTMAVEGLTLAEPTMLKLREEVMYQEYKPSKRVNQEGLAFSQEWTPPVPNLSATVKSVVRHDLRVVINYTREFDPEGQTEYSVVMSGTLANDSVAWQCKSGPAAAADLAAASAGGARVGAPLPSKWAPSGC